MQHTLIESLSDNDVIKSESECTCGETKCVDGKLWKCLDIGGGTCIWFITGEECTNNDEA